jgi:hypothetical protein
MRSLPGQDNQVVKLAYFGGYSNREIAVQVGLTEATVQRRLRRALSAISDHIQHGRALGRRAAFALAVWLSGRWLNDSAHHIAQTAAVASATVIVAVHPAAPTVVWHSQVPHASAAGAPAAAPPRVVPPVPTATPIVPESRVPTVAGPTVRLPLDAPPIPALPVMIKTPPI